MTSPYDVSKRVLDAAATGRTVPGFESVGRLLADVSRTKPLGPGEAVNSTAVAVAIGVTRDARRSWSAVVRVAAVIATIIAIALLATLTSTARASSGVTVLGSDAAGAKGFPRQPADEQIRPDDREPDGRAEAGPVDSGSTEPDDRRDTPTGDDDETLGISDPAIAKRLPAAIVPVASTTVAGPGDLASATSTTIAAAESTSTTAFPSTTSARPTTTSVAAPTTSAAPVTSTTPPTTGAPTTTTTTTSTMAPTTTTTMAPTTTTMAPTTTTSSLPSSTTATTSSVSSSSTSSPASPSTITPHDEGDGVYRRLRGARWVVNDAPAATSQANQALMASARSAPWSSWMK